MRLLIETGARRSEIAALTWDNVDLTLDRKRWPNITFTDSKNGTSRTIPLTLESIALLEAIATGERYGYGFVLKSPLNTREKSQAVRADAISKAWIRGRDRVEKENPGIQGLRLHDLRHTALTRLDEQVQDTILLSAISGQKDPKMLKRYVSPKPAGLAAMFGFDKPPAKKRAARKTPPKRRPSGPRFQTRGPLARTLTRRHPGQAAQPPGEKTPYKTKNPGVGFRLRCSSPPIYAIRREASPATCSSSARGHHNRGAVTSMWT